MTGFEAVEEKKELLLSRRASCVASNEAFDAWSVSYALGLLGATLAGLALSPFLRRKKLFARCINDGFLS